MHSLRVPGFSPRPKRQIACTLWSGQVYSAVMEVRAVAVIPSLNAEQSLGPVLRSALQHVGPVIVVDDGSRDETAECARKLGAHVVRHLENQGKGAALNTGLREAAAQGYTHAVTLDADGQHNPQDAAQLLEAARADPKALVIGARRFGPNVPGKSQFGREFSNFWVRLETGLKLSDTQTGFRIYPVESTLALQLPPSRFQWEVEVIVRSAWAGVPLIEREVSVYYPPPEERVSHYRGLQDSTLITLLHFKLLPRAALRPLWPVNTRTSTEVAPHGG